MAKTGENGKITRKDFIKKTAIGAAAVGAVAMGLSSAAKAQTAPSGGTAPSNTTPANSLLLNNRKPDGTWSNPSLPYPTSTYVDSRDDPYTANSPNPFDSKKNGFWDFTTDSKGNVVLTKPTIVNTRIHDVKFCNGTIPSSQVGPKGYSDPTSGIVDFIPEPVKKSMNGVDYYEYMALLSGVGYFPHGPYNYTHYVYGPFDNNGTDQSGPIDFDTWVANGAKPISQRNGLTYEPVYIAYPAQNWNGRLIHYMYPNHGQNYSFAWFFPYQTFVDVQYLLKQGYAICIHLTEYGLLDSEKNINAANNKWWDAVATWLTSPSPALDSNGFPILDYKMPARACEVDDLGNEPLSASNPSQAALFNALIGYNYPPGPAAVGGVIDGSLARNIVHFVKNLLYHKLGRKTDYAYLMGHCRSSETLMAVNCGRIYEQNYSIPDFIPMNCKINGLTPRTGGNFVDPYKPESGLVYNGFYDRGLFVEDVSADPQFPITAPMITTIGSIDEADMMMCAPWPMHNIKETIDSYGLDNSKYDLNKWVRYYVIDFGTHWCRSSFFATLYNGSGWFYQFGDGQPNQAGKGSQLNFYLGGIADALTRLGFPPGTIPPNPATSYNWGTLDNAWASAMEAGMIHKNLDNLVAWAERGIAPPKSRAWSDRILNAPYKVWVPDLPLYYWSNTCMQNNPWGDPNWPNLCWANDKKELSLFSTQPLWEQVGNQGIFFPTPYYLEKWERDGVTYDPATRIAWSVLDASPNPTSGLDPYWEYVFTQRLRPVMSDCCILSIGVDDQNNTIVVAPKTYVRDALTALAAKQLFDFSTEPLRMPNIEVRLGLFIADNWIWNSGGWWPYLYPFDATKLLNGYTDPYGKEYAGYANHGDYVNKMKDAVNSLVDQGLYDANIGQAVQTEAAQSPYPLKSPQPSKEQMTCQGFWSNLTQACYATFEERAKAEEKLAAFWGRGSGKKSKWAR